MRRFALGPTTRLPGAVRREPVIGRVLTAVLLVVLTGCAPIADPPGLLASSSLVLDGGGYGNGTERHAPRSCERDQ
jgi:hypothetical protein